MLSLTQAQELISPGVFLRGLELANSVRYTATFIKPTDNSVLRNLSVEITLPPDAQFTEMLVSRQVQFDVIRRNRQGQLTLIWQIARVDAETPLDAFSFTLAQPLSSELEFYMFWQDEQGQSFLENFFELPTTIRATETEGSISPINQEFAFVGNTGIQLSSASTNPLNFRVLANNFNPPAEYGAVWWCSLVELSGLAEGDSVIVLVPLRRPVAPFTELFLFQQQADESWLALDENGIVTADGQFVMYRHIGGLIATGGDEEIQQEVVPVEEAVIEEAPPQQENPQAQNNEQQVQAAPVENIVVEVQVSPVPQENPVETGNTNQQNPPQNNPAPSSMPPSPVPPTIAPAPTQAVQDGSSNTILIGEATFTPAILPTLGDDSVRSLPTLAPTNPATITDASSNTILVSEATFTPAILPTLGDDSVRFLPTSTQAIQDGTSNTILIGEATFTPTQGIQDGSSNTILVSEATFTPAILPTLGDGSVRFVDTPAPTQAVQDGTSNTIFITEATFTPAILVTRANGSVRFVDTPTPTQAVQDGTSNTILIGEATFTPTQGIQDGTSNTILIGEASITPNFDSTATNAPNPIAEASPIATLAVAPTQIVIISPPPFGQGGVRVVIIQSSAAGLLQCQIGGLLCAPLNRRAGNGLR